MHCVFMFDMDLFGICQHTCMYTWYVFLVDPSLACPKPHLFETL